MALAKDADAASAIEGLRKLPKADVHYHALLNCPLSTCRSAGEDLTKARP